MSASAPLLEGTGKKSKEITLDEAVYAAEVKPHLVHEAVRAELNARRAGTFATKSRGLVSGGRAKPWRQKGTGRARQGTIRAPQFKAGGHTFAKVPRSFVQKVNRKAQRSALRSALAAHAQAGTLGIVATDAFTTPSTKQAMAVLAGWAQPLPLVVVCLDEEAGLIKSFRNLPRVALVTPSELEVAAVVWARSLLISEAALELVTQRAV
jgi:large subunit ribosomal protein L4